MHAGVLTSHGDWERAERELLWALQGYSQLGSGARVFAVARLAELRVRQGWLGEARTLLEGYEDHPLTAKASVLFGMLPGTNYQEITMSATAQANDPECRGSRAGCRHAAAERATDPQVVSQRSSETPSAQGAAPRAMPAGVASRARARGRPVLVLPDGNSPQCGTSFAGSSSRRYAANPRTTVAGGSGMSPLRETLADYLRSRRAEGVQLRKVGPALEHFVEFLEERGAERVTVELAVEWATLTAAASDRHRANRLTRRRGAVLVRAGKGGRRREVGMDRWAWDDYSDALVMPTRC